MKKYSVLLMILFLSFEGCSFMVSPAIRVDNAIEKVGRDYQITEDISVAVFGNRADDIKDVFKDFGFSVVNSEPDYIVEVKIQNLGTGRAWRYLVYSAKIRLLITDNETKEEYYYKANAEFRVFMGGYGINSTYHYPSDPYGVAAKKAAAEAIGDFLEENDISHRWPKKK